jgi:RNA polymerase sigma-70 factor (ECF subfamily)
MGRSIDGSIPGDQKNETHKSDYNYQTMDDCELVAACQNRDKKAFEHLMKRYERKVNSWLFYIVPHWQDRSDLVQEAFTRVWCSIGALRRTQAFNAWLRHLVTNLAYDSIRDRYRKPVYSIDDPVSSDGEDRTFAREIADDTHVPDTLYERQELAGAINKAIAKLPDDFRIAVVLREMGGLPYAEIAERTNTRVGTVKSRISRARHKIRDLMDSYLLEASL